MVEQQDYKNQTISLTGPQALNVETVLQRYNEYSGKQLRLVVLPTNQAIAYHKKRGSVPPELADFLSAWASIGEALADGEMDFVDPAFERLLGRKPKTIDDLAPEIFEAETNELDTEDFKEVRDSA
jgi:uncharacterized protein YbjT (DUF2867 family)